MVATHLAAMSAGGGEKRPQALPAFFKKASCQLLWINL